MADKFSDLEKQIRDLNDKINRLGGKSFSNIDDILKSIKGNVKDANAYISQMNAEAEFLENAFDNISASLKNALNDLKGQSDTVRQVNKSYNKLESISRQIVDHQKNENILSIQKLKTLQKQSQEEINALKLKKEALENLGKLTGKNKAYHKEITDALNEETGILKDINSLIEKEIKLEQKRNSNLGITGGIFKGIHKSMKDIGIESEAFDRINTSMREAAANGNTFSTITAGIKSTASELKESFFDVSVSAAIIAKTFTTLKNIAFAYSETIFETQKALGTSYKNARELTNNLYDSWENTKGLYSTFQDLHKAQMALNSSTGTYNAYGVKALDNYTKLTEVAGLTGEEASKLQEYGDLYGKSSEEVYNNIGKTQKGLLSNKNVLSQVLKIEGQLAAQYGNDEKRLAKAVVQANKMGLSLEQAKNAASSLLDFEQSIENEISAELLTGKSLNLEKARGLALQGDSAGAAEEMLKQVGGIDKFNKMNVIQQEQIAKSMGMNADEMANALVKKKQYESLDKNQSEILKNRVAELKAAGKIEEANALEKSAIEQGNVELAAQQASDTMKVQKAMDNAKAAFMKGIAPIVESISNLLTRVMKTISDNPWIKSVLKVIGTGVAIAAAVASLAAIGNIISKAFGGGVQKVYVTNMGEGGGGGGSSFSGRGGAGMKLTKGLSQLFGGKKTMIGRGLRSTAAYLGKSGGITSDILGAASKGSKGAGFLGKAGSALAKGAKVLGPAGALLDLGLGTFQGAQAGSMSKEEQKSAGIRQGMGSTEGGIAGFLTGGAEKGSMLSSYAGIEKGSGADEAMGVAGAAGRGALVGAMFGPIGAAVGAGVGAIAETVKLLVNDESQLRKTISGWGESISEFASSSGETLKGWGSSMGDFFSSTFSKIGDMASSAWGGIKSLGSNIMGGISGAASSIGSSISNGVSNVGDFFGLAEGGIVTGPTKALIGEAGQSEAVIPLNQFYAKLDQLIAAVSNPQTNDGMVIKLDGQKVGEALRLGTRAVQ